MNTKAERAIELHKKGYNCAQAVACTFCKELGINEEEMFRIWNGDDGNVRRSFRNDNDHRTGEQRR